MHANLEGPIQGRRNWGGGGQEGQPPPVALYQEGQGGQRCPFNLQDCLGEIVQFVYEFASENARNAVTEFQE